MQQRFMILALLLAFLSLARGADNVSQALQKGLLEEEANQNLNAAIQEYQAVLQQFDEQRKIAATATFRLGECYRKLGKTNEALVQFQNVIRDFADQSALVKLSQKYLADAGRGGTVAVTSNPPSPIQTIVDPAQVKLLREEMALVEQQLKEERMKAEVGRASPEDIIQIKRQLIPLERKLPENASPAKQEALINEEIGMVQQLLAADEKRLQNGRASSADLIPLKRDLLGLQRDLLAVQEFSKPRFQNRLQAIVHRAEPELLDEESKEIQVVRDMIQNSPDLINAPNSAKGDANSNYTPLQDAAAKGQLAVARFLLENHADINVGAGWAGGTALHFAALNGHKSMVELLLAHGAAVDARNQAGETPLYIAAGNGFHLVAEVLLTKGADVNARTDDGKVPLHVAVAQRHTSMVELLLAHKADVNAQDKHGETALIFAVMGKDAELVNALLVHHADPNLTDTPGSTALTISVARGLGAITLLLLEHGADPNVQTKFNLNDQEEESTPLIYAVRTKNAALITLLIEHGADVNKPDSIGRAPLQLAVRDAIAPLVNLLLSKGADPNVKDPEGNTPLLEDLRATSGPGNPAIPSAPSVASQNVPIQDALMMELQRRANPSLAFPPGTRLSGSVRAGRWFAADRITILDQLLAHKADVNTTNIAGFTPLLKAVQDVGDTNVISLLLAHGADVNQLTVIRGTPLLLAVAASDHAIASLLLAKGADTNHKGVNDEAPLHVAAARGDTKMMDILLKNGADPNIEDVGGNTPIFYAAFDGNKEAAQMLVTHGAKLDIVNRQGVRPTAVAEHARQGTGAYGVPSFTGGTFIGGTVGMNERQLQVRDFLIQAAKQATTK